MRGYFFHLRRNRMELKIIHTTVNLGINGATRIEKSAEKLGVTRSRLVVLLLRKVLVHWKSLKRNMDSVKYQKNIDGEEWKAVHVFFEARDYEMFIDMRKFFKWSVSALVAMAISKYLDEILIDGKEGIKRHFDNYLVTDYHCSGKLDKNNICWHIIWGFDEKFAQKLHL